MIHILLATTLSTLLPQEPTPSSLEIVPLRPLHESRSNELPPFGTLMPDREQEQLRRDLLESTSGGDDGEGLPVRLLEILYGDGSDRGIAWQIQDRNLYLTGPRDRVEEARRMVSSAQAIVDRPIVVAAELRLPAADTPPQVLARVGAGDRAATIWSSSGTVATGRTIVFDAMRWVRYVRGANVEVAQKSTISNPVLDVFGEGICVAVQAHALCDSDDVVLFVQFACGQRRRIDSVSTNVSGQSSIDQPLIESTFATAAARVPAGSELRIVLDGDSEAGGRIELALQPTAMAAAAPLDAGVVLLPIRGLTSPALVTVLQRPDSIPACNDQFPQGETDDGLPALSVDVLVDIVQRAVGEGTAVEYLSGHLLVAGPPAAQQRARTVVTSLQDRLLRTVAVLATAELEAVAAPDPFAANAADAARPRVMHAIALPTLPGRRALAFRGLESTAIRTMLPEIAQEASITTPLVERRQSGLWLDCAVRTADPGEPVELRLQLDQHSAPQLRNLVNGGALQLGDTDSLRAHRHQPFSTAAVTLGTGTPIQFAGRSWRPQLRVQRLAIDEAR